MKGTVATAGLAIFSMFFGAGNVFVPLLLGKTAGDQIGIALCGFLITAIGAPMLGLFSTILCQGDSRAFFLRGGRVVGYTLMGVCLALLGPFAVLPRCLIVSHAAISPYLPHLGMWGYSAIALGVLFLLMVRRGSLLSILGKGLSPLLLLLLLVLIGVGLMTPGTPHVGEGGAFLHGLGSGYDTMDLLASVLFASAIWSLLGRRKDVGKVTLMAGCIGGGLLALVYVGMGVVAARHGLLLEGIATEGLLTQLARSLLGSELAFVANLAVALACLTTIMGLCVAITNLLKQLFKPLIVTHRPEGIDSRRSSGAHPSSARFTNLPSSRYPPSDHFLPRPLDDESQSGVRDRFPYLMTVAVMLLITGGLANLGFGPIAKVVHGAAMVCYPLMIGLALWNTLIGKESRVGVKPGETL